MTRAPAYPNEPWSEPWPEDGLETVDRCPVCGNDGREMLYSGLIDNTFFTARGRWTLWQCADCRSAYLDPRPTQATIHLAYEAYYTHQSGAGKDDYASLGTLRRLRRRLVNGYTNWRFATRNTPSSRLGIPVAFALPGMRRVLDREYRHLPRRPAGGRLLDVGCGDGGFLTVARGCGWDVTGLDPDPRAVANAARAGLIVHQGGLEVFEGQTALFDVITLNHVIEHIHDPVAAIRACHALLRPEGQLWMETPNIDSFGHARFQQNWRGLESPRHLVLFNRASLIQALRANGFSDPRDGAHLNPTSLMFRRSHSMAQSLPPGTATRLPRALRIHATLATLAGKLLPARRDFLALIAHKPRA